MMRRLRHAHGDEGVAAVEMALISSVLLLLGLGALPLYQLARAYQITNNSSADTLRYATSVDANAHTTTSGAVTRRPTSQDIVRFAQAASSNSNLTVRLQLCPDGSNCHDVPTSTAASAAVSGDTVIVTVSQDVDLRLFGSVANAIGNLVGSGDVYPQGSVSISSTSTGREE